MLSRNYPLLQIVENPLIAGGLQRIGGPSPIGKNVTTECIVMISWRSYIVRNVKAHAPRHSCVLHMADKRGKPIGYTATHLERLLQFLNFVISDNENYIAELKRTLASAPITEKVANLIE
jgi:hypothetical protein